MVTLVPRTPNAEDGHLPTRPGMEPASSTAPLRTECMGWQILRQVFLVNYGGSMSSGYAAHTRTIAYSGVPEAAGLLALAECHFRKHRFIRHSILRAAGRRWEYPQSDACRGYSPETWIAPSRMESVSSGGWHVFLTFAQSSSSQSQHRRRGRYRAVS